jgi:uncharacterized YccA/Bax inhibitor family protein
MIDDCIAALEATALARALRGSVWAYPLVNAGHILGVALLVGAIVPLDMRLLGVWSSAPLAPLWRVLTRTAGVGLVLVFVCGALLFITRARDYVHSGLFITKMVFVGIGLANALVLHRTISDDRLLKQPAPNNASWPVRCGACMSLVAWLVVLVLGRLIGYF